MMVMLLWLIGLVFLQSVLSFQGGRVRLVPQLLRPKAFSIDDIGLTITVPARVHAALSNGLSLPAAKSLCSEGISTFLHVVRGIGMERAIATACLVTLSAVVYRIAERKSPSTLPSTDSYNAQELADHFGKQTLTVLLRMVQMVTLSVKFNTLLLLDFLTGKLATNEKKRALDAAELLMHLGPTYVKMGQALSIRTDIISPAYADGLRTLQDSVTPFDTDVAQKILCQELNITAISERFKAFSPAPVASASIGQVYKATLLDGREVAVKIQRPDVRSSIMLDLHVLRSLTPIQVRVANLVAGMPTNTADIEMAYSLVDEWGRGLVAELDYLEEAANTKAFSEAMRRRGLVGIMAPDVVDELCTRKVLVSEWIEGTRLDRDFSADVPRLCGTAVNAYLTMLLDTGTLHCDPHPGNLLRTKDGRLCILDWGMTLSVPQDLQYSLLEFIAHCNTQDFSQLAEDFVKLGATPADKIEQVRQSGIPEGFAYIMKQLNAGGGPAQLTNQLRAEFKARYGDMSDAQLSLKCREGMIHSELGEVPAGAGSNVAGVTGVLEMMSKRNRDIFKLPSYMLYVARAFATLEGIGLSTDPNYSILRECYPYLAKRLLTDNSPRCCKVLKDMLYKDGQLSATKLVEFSEGFRSYTASTAQSSTQEKDQYRATQALTDLILDAENSLVQELLSDGVAMYGDSLLREGISQARHSTAGRLLRAVLRTPKTIVDMVVPGDLKLLALPLTLPYDIARAVTHLLDVSQEDSQNVKSAREIMQHLRPATPPVQVPIPQQVPSAQVREPAPATVAPEKVSVLGPIRRAGSVLRKRVPGVVHLSRRMAVSLLTRTAQRLDAADRIASQAQSLSEREDVNREIEMLVTEGLGSIASTAAKYVAGVLA